MRYSRVEIIFSRAVSLVGISETLFDPIELHGIGIGSHALGKDLDFTKHKGQPRKYLAKPPMHHGMPGPRMSNSRGDTPCDGFGADSGP